MAKLQGLLEAAGNFIGSSSATGPMPGLLEPIDTDRIARKLELEVRGAERGRRRLPSSQQTVFDEVEQTIVQEINNASVIQHGQVIGTLKALRRTVERFNVKSKLAQLRLVASEAQARFTEARQKIRGDLKRLQNESVAAHEELALFRKKHRLSRPARLPANPWTSGGLLLLVLAFETALNGLFFAKGSELGLIGGIGVAFGASALNVAFCFFLGFGLARQINRRFFPLRAMAALLTVTLLVGIVAFHLFIAHFRDATALVGEGAAYRTAVQTILQEPWALTEIQSWFLFGLGTAFSIIAFSKGYGWDDPYPGYGAVTRRALDAEMAHEGARQDLFADLGDTTDAAVHDFKTALASLPIEAQQADNARSQASALAQKLALYEDHLEEVANSLLARYRDANGAARPDRPPARFDERWHLTPRTDPLSLLGDTGAAATENMDAVLAEIQELHDGLLTRYQDLLEEAGTTAGGEVRA
jgi:hypothetical protein